MDTLSDFGTFISPIMICSYSELNLQDFNNEKVVSDHEQR